MCSTGPATSYGYELAIAMETDLDDLPRCCGEDMTGEDAKSEGRDYTCADCGTVMSIAASGLVDDITEPATA